MSNSLIFVFVAFMAFTLLSRMFTVVTLIMPMGKRPDNQQCGAFLMLKLQVSRRVSIISGLLKQGRG